MVVFGRTYNSVRNWFSGNRLTMLQFIAGGTLSESTGVRFHRDETGGHAPGVITPCASSADGSTWGLGSPWESMGPEWGQLAGDAPEAQPQLCPRASSPPALFASFIQTQPLPCSGSQFVLV